MSKARNTFLITTPRLILRPFERGDAAALYSLNSNSAVLRYTGDSAFATLAAAVEFIESYDHYARHGFGRWAVIHKREDRFIGFCGLRRDESNGEVDLGFRFFQQYWSKGFATEAGQASLETGFNHYGLETIVGRCLRENLPSISVLQKLGMEFSDVREDRGLMWLIYSIDRDSWSNRLEDD